MKKKTIAKILALALCAVLLVTGTVFVTLAYLQDHTDVVKNTFTTGNVSITLDEAKVNAKGQPVDQNDAALTPDLANGQYSVETLKTAVRTNGEQKYKIYPKGTYTKDPTVHIGSDSDDCFVYVAIKNTLFTAENGYEVKTGSGLTIAEQLDDNGWVQFSSMALKTENVTDPDLLNFIKSLEAGKYSIYYLNEEAHAGESYPLFTSITINEEITELNVVNTSIEVVAFAVQTEGFEEEKIPADQNQGADAMYRRAYYAFTETYGGDEQGDS